jgi:deoxyribonuclease-4
MSNVYAIDWDVGAHTKFYQKVAPTISEAINCGMYTLQFFMGNPQSFKRQRITEEDIENAKVLIKKFPMYVFSHFPYVANFAGKSSNDGLAWNGNKSINSYLSNIISELEYELYVMSQIGNGVVIHPGSFPDREKGLVAISKSINKINFSEGSMVLLENCAGEGNKLCRNFQEIKSVLESIDKDKRKHVGVCVDTAHIWGQGDYDLRKVDEIERMFYDFDNIIGMEHFKLLHLNDSEVSLGEKKDRHACLGIGYIWSESFESLVYLLDKCKSLGIPMVLETDGSDMFTLSMLSDERVCEKSFMCVPCVEQCECCMIK